MDDLAFDDAEHIRPDLWRLAAASSVHDQVQLLDWSRRTRWRCNAYLSAFTGSPASDPRRIQCLHLGIPSVVKQTKRFGVVLYIGNYRRRILSHIAVTPTANQHQERTNLLKFAEPP